MHRLDRLQTAVIRMYLLYIGLVIHLYQIYQHYVVELMHCLDRLQIVVILICLLFIGVVMHLYQIYQHYAV